MVGQAGGVYLIVEPDHARVGDEVTVALVGAESPSWLGGLYADLQRETPEGWETIFHLTGLPKDRGSAFPPPVVAGQPLFRHAVGIRGPIRFLIPEVAPGTYQFLRQYVQPGPITMVLYATVVVSD